MSGLQVILTVFAMAGWAGTDRPAAASSSAVELKGRIARVQLTPGNGMPFLLVERKGEPSRVTLGSLRYLMLHDFSPKAGDEVVVKGYLVGDEVVAVTITLPAEKKSLRLRNNKGQPMWRGQSEKPM